MFACPGLIFYTVCSVPWLNGNLALAEKRYGPLRFRLRQVLLYNKTFQDPEVVALGVAAVSQVRYSAKLVLLSVVNRTVWRGCCVQWQNINTTCQ